MSKYKAGDALIEIDGGRRCVVVKVLAFDYVLAGDDFYDAAWELDQELADEIFRRLSKLEKELR